MKKDQKGRQDEPSSKPEKSFSVAIKQMAQLLRSEVKLKERGTRVLCSSSLHVSFKNSLERIAKLLRSQVHSTQSPKKRTWKRQSPKRRSSELE